MRGRGGALLDRFLRRRRRGRRADEDPREVDVLGVDLAGLDELLDLGDGDPAGHGGERR